MKSKQFVGDYAPYVLGGLALAALLLVTVARVSGISSQSDVAQVAARAVVNSRQLRFEDGQAGAVEVYDWRDGALLASFPSGDGSFVRGVLRSMTRERRALEAGAEAPFLLARRSDGALTISDQATGRTIVLNAFGPDNAGVFARLLDAGQARS